MSRKKTTEQFIAEAKQVHGDKYDYMNPIGEDKIEFCSNNYGEESILGCLRVMAFLKQKENKI